MYSLKQRSRQRRYVAQRQAGFALRPKTNELLPGPQQRGAATVI